jgi:ribosome modulation factor
VTRGRAGLLERLTDAGYRCAIEGKPCEPPVSVPAHREAWIKGWRTGDMMRKHTPPPEPVYRLTLTTADGELLESWTVAYDLPSAPPREGNERLDLAYPVVRGELVQEIISEIRKRNVAEVRQ